MKRPKSTVKPGVAIQTFGSLVAVPTLFACGYWLTNRHLRGSSAISEMYAAKTAQAELDVWTTLLSGSVGTALIVTALAALWLYKLMNLEGIAPTALDVSSSLGAVLVFQVILVTSLIQSTSQLDEGLLDVDVSGATAPVTVVVAACITPLLAGFIVIRLAARSDNWPVNIGSSIERLGDLRLLLHRMTTVAGALLTMTVVTTEQRRRALNTFASMEVYPVEQVLVYGAMLSLTLWIFFALANTAVSETSREVVSRMFPITERGGAGGFAQLERRSKALASLAGPESWKRFESGVAIALPLLSAGISTAVD